MKQIIFDAIVVLIWIVSFVYVTTILALCINGTNGFGFIF